MFQERVCFTWLADKEFHITQISKFNSVHHADKPFHWHNAVNADHRPYRSDGRAIPGRLHIDIMPHSYSTFTTAPTYTGKRISHFTVTIPSLSRHCSTISEPALGTPKYCRCTRQKWNVPRRPYDRDREMFTPLARNMAFPYVMYEQCITRTRIGFFLLSTILTV